VATSRALEAADAARASAREWSIKHGRDEGNPRDFSLGATLLEVQKLTLEQVDAALQHAQSLSATMFDSLLALDMLDEDEVLPLAAGLLKQQYLTGPQMLELQLGKTQAAMLARDTADDWQVIPLKLEAGGLTVAMIDPSRIDVLDDIKLRARARSVTPVRATERTIQEGFARIYDGKTTPPEWASKKPAAAPALAPESQPAFSPPPAPHPWTAPPAFSPPAHPYGAPQPSFSPPASNPYGAPPSFSPPAPNPYAAPQSFSPPASHPYGAPQPFSPPAPNPYGAPQSFSPPAPNPYGAPQPFSPPAPHPYGAPQPAPAPHPYGAPQPAPAPHPYGAPQSFSPPAPNPYGASQPAPAPYGAPPSFELDLGTPPPSAQPRGGLALSASGALEPAGPSGNFPAVGSWPAMPPPMENPAFQMRSQAPAPYPPAPEYPNAPPAPFPFSAQPDFPSSGPYPYGASQPPPNPYADTQLTPPLASPLHAAPPAPIKAAPASAPVPAPPPPAPLPPVPPSSAPPAIAPVVAPAPAPVASSAELHGSLDVASRLFDALLSVMGERGLEASAMISLVRSVAKQAGATGAPLDQVRLSVTAVVIASLLEGKKSFEVPSRPAAAMCLGPHWRDFEDFVRPLLDGDETLPSDPRGVVLSLCFEVANLVGSVPRNLAEASSTLDSLRSRYPLAALAALEIVLAAH
jgi:hypothetical protein